MIDSDFWLNKQVFITGHTGFKGSWLSVWLDLMGAKVTGYSLDPPTNPSLFELCNINQFTSSIHGDIRDYEKLSRTMRESSPEIVIHMAAQPIVRESYNDPLTTYSVNVMGTANVLESVRNCPSVKAVVVVTSDKCYENKEWPWGYRETDTLGGHDPYSSSKACTELVTSSYLHSFFQSKDPTQKKVYMATVRAGNVIGGGDWAKDRLIPDCIQSIFKNKPITIRFPDAIRPWQHVLEPLGGYLLVAERLYKSDPTIVGSWNFGPDHRDAKPVKWIVSKLYEKWGYQPSYVVENTNLHEAHYLKLDCSKAKEHLHWTPRWDLEEALNKIIEWYKVYQQQSAMLTLCRNQITEYMHGEKGRNLFHE